MVILVLKRGVVVINVDPSQLKLNHIGIHGVILLLCLLCASEVYSFAIQIDEAPWSNISGPIDEALRRGRIEEVLDRSNQEVIRTQARVGNEHPDLALALSQFGRVYQALNRFEEARSYFERALKIRTAVFGEIHSSVAVSLLDIADTYREAGQYTQAAPFYERALSTMEKAKGPNHEDVAVVLHNFAALRNFQVAGAAAEAYINRAIAIRENNKDTDPYAMSSSLVLLEAIYEQDGKYRDARVVYDKALTIMNNAGLDQTYSTGMLVFGIGNLEKRMANYKEAEGWYKKSINIIEKVSGPESPTVIPILREYADVLRRLKKLEEAKKVDLRESKLMKRFYENK